jgi:D-alanyl-D-alanine carboxypeptidase
MKNRVGRIIVAILALIAFGFYAYRYEQTHWHSADVEAWGPATGLHPEGFEQGVVMNQEPEAPIQMEYAPAPTEQPAAAPAPAEQPVVETVPTEQPLRFDLSEWQYMLVNGDHSIDQYEPENLVYLNMTADETDFQTSFNPNRIAVDARIAQPLMDMALACKAAGLPVYLSSGYRSYADQAANFTRVCQNNGITDGKDSNGHYITMPAGCSEHQTGLCIDITDYYHEIKNDELAQLPTVQWLAEHCADYGFVLRFPQDKRDVTHVMGESWHFRYVGEEAAKYMTENNLVLEEFVALYGVE